MPRTMPGPAGYRQGEHLSQMEKLRPERLAVHGQDLSRQDWNPGQHNSECHNLRESRFWRRELGVSEGVGVLDCPGASCR